MGGRGGGVVPSARLPTPHTRPLAPSLAPPATHPSPRGDNGVWRNAAGGGLRWTPRRPSTPPSHSPTHFIPPPRLPPLPPSLSSHPPPPSPVQHAHRPPLPPLCKSTAHPPPNHPTAQQQSHARSHPPGTWYGQYAAPAQRRPALPVRASTAPLSLPPPAAKWEASTPAAAAAAHPGRPRPPPPSNPRVTGPRNYGVAARRPRRRRRIHSATKREDAGGRGAAVGNARHRNAAAGGGGRRCLPPSLPLEDAFPPRREPHGIPSPPRRAVTGSRSLLHPSSATAGICV